MKIEEIADIITDDITGVIMITRNGAGGMRVRMRGVDMAEAALASVMLQNSVLNLVTGKTPEEIPAPEANG